MIFIHYNSKANSRDKRTHRGNKVQVGFARRHSYNTHGRFSFVRVQ